MAEQNGEMQSSHQHATIVIEPRTPSIITQSDGDEPSFGSRSRSSTNSSGPAPNPGQPLWTHRVSASFSAMADQIAAASQAIAMIPPLPDAVYGQLSARMDEIEKTQMRLEANFNGLREELQSMTEGPEKFQKQLDEQIAAFKLEQLRLPARLHNSLVTVSKVAIKPLPMANGKLPPMFPATRGEFEHMIKERYEAIMKIYDIPITGDTAAKRETLRSFIGLPQ